MDRWLNFPWIETFLLSTYLIGALSCLILLLNKSPSGRWLGFLLFSSLLALFLDASGYDPYLPSSLTLIMVSSYLYYRAFFYQKRRTPVYHLFILILVIPLNFFLVHVTLLTWTIALAGVLFYLVLISQLLVNEGRSRGFSYFINPGSRIVWLRNFIGLESIFIISLVLPFGSSLKCGFFLLLISHILFQLFKESSFLSPIPMGNKYKKSRLTPELKSSIIDRLEEVMVEDHFYRRDDASLGKLASRLGVTNHHLSQVLNESMGLSFQDLLARFRIREACRLLRNEDHEKVKIETIANMVGYNSKSSFNTAFKKRTGLTPSEYRYAKNVRIYGGERLAERETPSYVSGRFSLNHVFNLKLNRNMIRISIRNLRKHRLHSALNVIGLAIGLSACLTIAAYVQYELSYDQHHPDAGNLHRIALNRIYPDYNKELALTAPILAHSVSEIIPEIEQYTRFQYDDYMFGRVGEKLEKQRITSVDSGFFQMFDVKVISGEVANDIFEREDGIILTQKAVRKYFDGEDPVGQLFSIQIPDEEKQRVMKVEAVISDPLPTSHFDYEILAPVEILPLPEWFFTEWGTWGVFSYLKVHPGTDLIELRNKINAIAEENAAIGDDGYNAWLEAGNRYDYFLQPVTDIHLTSNLLHEFEANSSETFVYFFALVGVFILLMAVANFVNLATARASYRTMEVGIRKAVGAGRGDLMAQFLTESTLTCLVAMLIALPLVQLFLPYFNETIGKSLSYQAFASPLAILILLSTPIILGVLSGFYPALYLSHFGPAAVFQKLMIKRGKEGLRHMLVIGQLLIAVLLISGTITVYRQMNYMINKPIGFDKEQLVKIDKLPFMGPSIDFFKNEARKIPGVKNIATSSFPFNDIRDGATVSSEQNPDGWVNTTMLNIDENYLSTTGMKLIAGRNLLPDEVETTDRTTSKVILNVTAAKALGWTPDEAINQPLFDSEQMQGGVVIGVVEDFNFTSLHRPARPYQLSGEAFPGPFRSASIRLDPRQTKEALASLEKIWTELAPDKAFDYEYVDKAMTQYYEVERLAGKLFIIFAALGIFICCLGLFGLMGYVVEQRSKEVGIRKVMGARISHIILLLSKDYVRLVLISSVVAIPLAWIGLGKWLDSFAYRIDNSVWTLILAGLLVTIISWVTVALYSYHAAQANPVKSLRSE